MSVIADLPDIRPSLLLDFANSGRVHPLIQCTRASTATYFGPDGLLRGVPANVPRIDYYPETGKCLGLLIEEAGTNLLLQSEDLTASAWAKTRSTIAPQVMLSPDGVSMADAIVSDLQQASEHYAAQANVVSSFAPGDKFCFSAFVKPAAKTKVALRLRRTLTPASYITGFFDLVTGATNITGATGGATLTLMRKTLPNGWHWCSIEYVAGAADGADSLSAYVYPCEQMTVAQYDGTGQVEVYVWGMQITKRQYPSSYIPTRSSAATRAMDSVLLPAAVCAEHFGAAFTVVQQLSTRAPIPAAGSLRHLGASIYAGGNNRARIYANSTNGGRIAFSGRLNGVTDTFAVSTTTGLGSVVPPVCAAFALSPSGFGRACVNGGAVVTSSPQSGSLSGLSPAIYIGSLSGDFNATDQSMNGHMQRLAIYSTVLPDVQLQRLSQQ